MTRIFSKQITSCNQCPNCSEALNKAEDKLESYCNPEGVIAFSIICKEIPDPTQIPDWCELPNVKITLHTR